MGFLSDVLGGIGKGQGYLRGPDHVNTVFGLNNSKFLNAYPKLKFEHFIRFNLSDPVKYNTQPIAALVKTADYPSMNIETATINQYNKKRVIQKRIDFDKINIVIHDVADGKTLDFWKRYYNYYYKDGADANHKDMFKKNSNEKNQGAKLPQSKNVIEAINPEFYTRHGLNAVDAPFFESIELFYSRGKLYDKVILIKPKIAAFRHDSINYEDGTSIMQLSFTLEYENVIYGETRLFNDATAKRDVPSRLKTNMPARSPDNGNPLLVGQGKGSKEGSIFDKAFKKITDDIVSDFTGNLQSTLVRGLTTGNFKLNPNPVKQFKNSVKNYGNNISGQLVQSFVSEAIESVSSSINEAGQSASEDDEGGNG